MRLSSNFYAILLIQVFIRNFSENTRVEVSGKIFNMIFYFINNKQLVIPHYYCSLLSYKLEIKLI
jgi:hypothetical protein